MIAWSYTFVKLIFRVYNIELFNIYQMDKSIGHTVKFCFYKTVYPLDFRQALILYTLCVRYRLSLP